MFKRIAKWVAVRADYKSFKAMVMLVLPLMAAGGLAVFVPRAVSGEGSDIWVHWVSYTGLALVVIAGGLVSSHLSMIMDEHRFNEINKEIQRLRDESLEEMKRKDADRKELAERFAAQEETREGAIDETVALMDEKDANNG